MPKDVEELSAASAGSVAYHQARIMGWLKRRIIESLEPTMAEWERRWIPVDESLPEEGVDVLMAHSVDGWVGCGACYWSRPGGAIWSYGETEMQYPTHWMPLPAPPEDAK